MVLSSLKRKIINRIIIIVIILLGLNKPVLPVQAEKKEALVFIALEEYVQMYLAHSVSIKEATRELEKAERNYRQARDERVASLHLTRLETTAGTARLALAEGRGGETVSAVRRYFQYLQARRELTTVEEALRLEEEKLRITGLRYEAGLNTEIEFLQQKNACLAAEEEVETAKYEYIIARQAFLRGIEQEDETTFTFLAGVDLTGIKPEEYDFARCLQGAKKTSAAYYSARKTLAVSRKQWAAVQDPAGATDEERKNAAYDLEAAEENYYRAERELHDRIFGLLEEYKSLLRRLDLAQRQVALATREVEVAKIRFSQGEIRGFDLDQAKLRLQEAADQVNKVMEDLFLQQLLLVTAAGHDPSPLIAGAATGSGVL